MENWIFSQRQYKYDVGYMSQIVEGESRRDYLIVRNNRKKKIEINIQDIEKLGINTCVSMRVTNK